MIRIIILLIGIILLFNVAMLSLVSNFNLGLVLQGIVSVLFILYAWKFNSLISSVHRIIVIVCSITLMLTVFLAAYGNVDNAKYDEEVCIILGAGIHGEVVSVPLARRLDEAAEYHKKNPKAFIVVCGGQGYQENITEALAMERYLIGKGVSQDKIIKEDKSTSTYENLVFAKTILDEKFAEGYSSVLITNDFHVYRATRLAKYAGVSVRHIGAYTEWYTLPVNYLREILAVAKMWAIPPNK